MGGTKRDSKVMNNSYSCELCLKKVKRYSSFSCDRCEQWCHITCSSIPENVYDFIDKSKEGAGFSWCCCKCRKDSTNSH